MRRQERVEIGETLFAEVRVVVLGVLQLGVVSQRLTMGIEQLAKLGLARWRFTEQTAVANLFDVARFKVDLNREAVFQLVELVGVQRGARVIFRQRLLRGRDDPCLAVAQPLEVLGQAIEVEDQVVTRGHVLTDFVDDEDDVLLAALFADDVDHLLHALVFELKEAFGAG